MREFLYSRISFLTLFSIFIFVSCSKDSVEPDPTKITVSPADFSKTIDENPMNGQVIGSVSGNTNDGTVTFSITEQTPSGAFSIDAASGELKVADETLFDFETNPTISGTVQVSNGVVSENASVVITLNDLFEENIYDRDAFLQTQEEVNEFGANNYTRINGMLFIGKWENNGYSDIVDLSPLQTLNYVRDGLYIQFNELLTTTSGLENLEHVIRFEVWSNPALVNVVGFNNLEDILAGVSIKDNPVLSNLEGLSNLKNIGSSLFLNKNYSIPNLDWLSNLTSIDHGLSIGFSPLITSLNGLSNLIYLGDHLSLTHNDSLNDLSGLQNLTATLGRLSITENNSLTTLDGLQNLTFTTSLLIYGNNALTDLSPLLNTTSLSGGFEISQNDSLTDLNFLNNLTNLGSSSLILHNINLESLNGLSNLTEAGLYFYVRNNDRLTDFCELQHAFTVGGNTSFDASGNLYNPTKQDIIDGNCSL